MTDSIPAPTQPEALSEEGLREIDERADHRNLVAALSVEAWNRRNTMEFGRAVDLMREAADALESDDVSTLLAELRRVHFRLAQIEATCKVTVGNDGAAPGEFSLARHVLRIIRGESDA